MILLEHILRKNKAFFLAYDQGLEHGPADLNMYNADPHYIFELAVRGKFTAVIVHRGIAERYYKHYRLKVPLILKLNGKTNLPKSSLFSSQLATVEEAVALGASAVGYTIYLGSEHEAEMLATFTEIARQAHKNHIPAIAWMYPGGQYLTDNDPHFLAYAVRVGLEIGADMVKVKWSGDAQALQWAVQVAGTMKVVVAGGNKHDEEMVYQQARQVLQAGASGLAIGRNIWQQEDPLTIAENLHKIIFG